LPLTAWVANDVTLGIITNDNDGKAIDLSARIILIYSATICATDSVAALTMIKPNQYPKLFSIVFGEGMINDAVAIILFRSVQ
jgi:NhaP-type Na+/H+ or K+/H+ antiporter